MRIVAIVFLLSGVALSCTEDRSPTGLRAARVAANAIIDGTTSGDPDFFWLPPTVSATPAFTGEFDATVLDQLAIEICELDASGVCAGPPVEGMTSTSSPPPSRITLDTAGESYDVEWRTGPSHLSVDNFYRVRVLRNGAELGSLDVDPVRDPPALASVDRTRYTGVVNGRTLALRFRIQAASARRYVRINEVESRLILPGDELERHNGDWIELYNSAPVPVSIGGYVLRKDSDIDNITPLPPNNRSFTIPAGTMIPAHGFYVVGEAEMAFTLYAPDGVRFFAPDTTTQIDAFAWTTHSPTTYARCPDDGTGAFAVPRTVTKGAANDCGPPTPININEIFWSFTATDWFELYNPGAVSVDLTGYFVELNDGASHFTIRSGTVIPAHGYVVIDGADYGFSFGGASEVAMYMPDDQTRLDVRGSFGFGPTSLGRCPDGTGAFARTASITKGTANDCGVPTAAATVSGAIIRAGGS